MSSLVSSVRIREVGPRDGFQNEPELIATPDKIALIDALARTGLARIEVGSFVRPDVIPQLADTAEVIAGISIPDPVDVAVLVPNERGFERALALRERIDEVVLFLSASETHNRRNVGLSVADSLAIVERLVPQIREAGMRPLVSIATSFGCPYEGRVPADRVHDVAERCAAAGAAEVGFGDTTGMANPRQVRDFYAAMSERLPEIELTAHFHNTRGQGLANAFAALESGVSSFESSFGELGGCPFPPGSTGNIATEDLISMFHEMGVQTGVDLDALLGVTRRLQELLRRPLGSHVLTAGPVVWNA
jgi:hydroxymethylglutaryl-CoA lyase